MKKAVRLTEQLKTLRKQPKEIYGCIVPRKSERKSHRRLEAGPTASYRVMARGNRLDPIFVSLEGPDEEIFSQTTAGPGCSEKSRMALG